MLISLRRSANNRGAYDNQIRGERGGNGTVADRLWRRRQRYDRGHGGDNTDSDTNSDTGTNAHPDPGSTGYPAQRFRCAEH
jgi:hypothetical protein